MADEKPTIIVKRVKKVHGGHHGGSWKVAFADFVTAMMAFFMLMWLTSSTTPQQKAAISDYFEFPSAVPATGGGSTSVIDLGGSAPEMPRGEGDNSMEASQDSAPVTPDKEAAEKIAQEIEKEKLESLRQELSEAIAQSEALAQFKDQLLLDITSEGLRIQIVDKENRAMFASGSPVLQSYTRDILREIVGVIDQVPNKISISGHTDQTPYSDGNSYSNWELSADRANAARRELVDAGMAAEKIARVVGLSSSVLFDGQDPYNPINRRISIIVMNKATEQSLRHGESKAEDPANR